MRIDNIRVTQSSTHLSCNHAEPTWDSATWKQKAMLQALTRNLQHLCPKCQTSVKTISFPSIFQLMTRNEASILKTKIINILIIAKPDFLKIKLFRITNLGELQ